MQGGDNEGGYPIGRLLAAFVRTRLADARAHVARAGGVYAVLATIVVLGVCSGASRQPTLEETALRSGTVADFLRDEKIRLYAARETDHFLLPTAAQIIRFGEALQAIQDYETRVDPHALVRARGLLRSVNYGLLSTTDGHWYLRDQRPARGWGSYVLNRAPRSRLTIEVPRALGERHALEAGVALYYETGAWALSVSGAPRRGIDVLAQRGTFYQAFHRRNAAGDVIAVRSASDNVIDDSPGWTPGGVSRIWISGNLPGALQLADLREWVGTLLPIWKASPAANLQRDTTARDYAELYLNGDDASRMVARLEPRVSLQTAWRDEALNEKLDEWLLRDRNFFATDEGAPTPPGDAQFAYFDREVLTPLVRLSESGYVRGKWSDSAMAQLRAIHYAANGMGYGITRVRDRRARQEFLVLDEAAPRRFYRGRYVLRAGGGDGYAVNVPDPANEPNALEYGLTLFESLKARALLVAGATQPAAAETPAPIASPHRSQSMFTLANQVLKRELGDEAFMIVISRGIAPETGIAAHADVSLALADGTMSRGDASPLAVKLLRVVQRSGLSYDFLDATKHVPEPVAMTGGDAEVATLWLSPRAAVAGSAPARITPVSLSRGFGKAV